MAMVQLSRQVTEAMAKSSRQVMIAKYGGQMDAHPLGCQCSQDCVSRIPETEQHELCVKHLAPYPCECEVCKYHRANPCNVCLKMTFAHQNCTCSTCFQVIVPSEGGVERETIVVKKEPVAPKEPPKEVEDRFEALVQTIAALRPQAEEEEEEEDEQEHEDAWGEPPLIPQRIDPRCHVTYNRVGTYEKEVATVKLNKRTVRVPDGLWVSREVIYMKKVTGTIELKIFQDDEEGHPVTLLRFCDTAGVTKFSYQSTSIKGLQTDYRKLTQTLHEKCQPPLIGAKEMKKSVLVACGIEKLWEAYQASADGEVVQDAQEVARALKKLKRGE